MNRGHMGESLEVRIRLPKDVHEQVKHIAETETKSMSLVLYQLLRLGLERRGAMLRESRSKGTHVDTYM